MKANIELNLSKELLTIRETQEYMKCSDVFLWKLRKTGKIQSVNAGRKVLLPKASIDAYLKLNQEEVSHG